MGSLDFSLTVKVKERKHTWLVILTGIPFNTFKVSLNLFQTFKGFKTYVQ